MKKFIFSFLLTCSVLLLNAQATAPRFGTTPNKDNTGRVLTYGYSAPAYVATLAITPNVSNYTCNAVLTGACTINLTVTKAKVCDVFTVITTGSGGSRVTTFGTGFISAGTLTAASGKQATATFMFDGTNYVEISRFVQP